MARGKIRPGPHGPARRSGRRDAKADESSRWLTTYADAITLLMAFFVLLYAMSEIDVMKFTAFLQGLRVPFGNESGDGLLPESDGLQPDVTPVPPGDPSERPEVPSRLTEEARHALEELQRSDRFSEGLLEQAQRRVVQEEQLDRVQRSLTEALAAEDLDHLVRQFRTERGLVVSIAADDILFALGSTVIGEHGRRIIEVVADTLDDYPNPLQIEGHTDNVPLDRNGYTNWNLSTDRAVAVLSLMVEEYGLPPDRVGAVGYGEYRPQETNETTEGRARNRRVDIVVLLDEEVAA